MLFYNKKNISINLAWWLWALASSDRCSFFFFFLATKMRAIYLTSLSLSFLICKMGIMVHAMRIK